jgi:hypothetical protein
MAPVHALDAQSPHAGVASAPGAAQSSSNRWWENDPWHSANTPLHRNIQGDGGNGVLTGEELGSVVALGVKETTLKGSGMVSCCCTRKRET